jgi:hypothetical protein
MNGLRFVLAAVVFCVVGAFPAAATQAPALVETFDDPALPGWERTGDVSVSVGRLHLAAPGAAFHQAEWSGDLSFTVWVQRSGAGALNVYYLAGGTRAQNVAIYEDHIALEVYRAGRLQESTEAAAAVPGGEWFQLGVSVEGATHTVTIDGAAVLAFDLDAADLTVGSIGFEAFDTVTAAFDDLVVYASAAPSVTAQQPPAAESTSAEVQPDVPPAVEAPVVAAPTECTVTASPGGLQAAVDAAQPGDVICAEPGDYTAEEEIIVGVSGAADNPVTVAANGDASLYALTLADGASHLRFYNFTVYSDATWSVTLSGNNEDVLFAGFQVGGGEAGFRMTYLDNTPVNNVTLADSVISGVVYTAVDCTPGPCNNMRFQRLEIYGGQRGEGDYSADGLAVEMGAHILVEDCYIHDIAGDGIDLNSRDAGQMPGIVVRRNRVFNTMQNGIKLWNGGAIANNVVWNAAVALVTEPGEYTIVNNTFVDNATYDYQVILGGYETGAPSTVRLHNNIFYNDSAEMGGTLVYIAPGVQLEADHNLYYNPYREDGIICAEFLEGETCLAREAFAGDAWFAQTGQDEHSLFFVDPAFVDATGGDFHPAQGSPALDAGASVDALPDTDLEGNPRAAGDAPDLGAYEQ